MKKHFISVEEEQCQIAVGQEWIFTRIIIMWRIISFALTICHGQESLLGCVEAVRATSGVPDTQVLKEYHRSWSFIISSNFKYICVSNWMLSEMGTWLTECQHCLTGEFSFVGDHRTERWNGPAQFLNVDEVSHVCQFCRTFLYVHCTTRHIAVLKAKQSCSVSCSSLATDCSHL